MECQVRSMAASGISEEISIPEGRVEAVCKEWLVREDGVMAYKLQSEEIEHHYGHNKERSQIIRSDFQEARCAQRTEEEEALAMQMEYDRLLREQEDHDARVARQLQDTLLQEEMEIQRRIEEEDQRIALELQRKEKLRLQRKREERELRQAEKARVELSCTSNSSSVKSMDDVREAATSPLDKDFSLLSLEPPDNLTPEEFQLFVEKRDAEMAKLLQSQERPQRHKCDQLLAIEAQDRELAKMLQDQERAKARRARERAKHRAIQHAQEESKGPVVAHVYDLTHLKEPQPVRERLQMPESSGSMDRRAYASNFSGESVNNIAAAIDPTFQSPGHPLRPLPPTPDQESPMPSPSSEVPPYTPPVLNDEFFTHHFDENSPAPPYMPIQGTRRPNSLEKTKKSRKSKDGCKTQ